MSTKYKTKYKKYDDMELRDLLIIYARIGLEASPQQIARVMSDAKVTRRMVYDRIQRQGKK